MVFLLKLSQNRIRLSVSVYCMSRFLRLSAALAATNSSAALCLFNAAAQERVRCVLRLDCKNMRIHQNVKKIIIIARISYPCKAVRSYNYGSRRAPRLFVENPEKTVLCDTYPKKPSKTVPKMKYIAIYCVVNWLTTYKLAK